MRLVGVAQLESELRPVLFRVRRDALGRLVQSIALDDHETLDYVVVVKDQWTMENGFLTPTMKIKRNVIEERYMPNAGHWITRKQKVIWED